MTLNITLITPHYILHASDRRMTDMLSRPVDDEGNKGLVLQTDNGAFAITFTGVSRFQSGGNGQRIDLWLAERLLDDGLPELPIEDGVIRIARAATDLFRKFPSSSERRLSFVIARWRRTTIPSGAMWVIANCIAEDGRTMLQLVTTSPSSPLTSMTISCGLAVCGRPSHVPNGADWLLLYGLRLISNE